MKRARQLGKYISLRKKRICKKIRSRAERRYFKRLLKGNLDEISTKVNKKMFLKGYA